MSQQQPDSGPSIAKHKVENSPEEALKYWTAEKKRKAKPAPQPHIDVLHHEKQRSQHDSQPSDGHNP